VEEAEKERKRERRAAGVTWREKGWYEIFAPPMFGEAKVGETAALDARELPGRVFETTLGDLIEDFSKSHIRLRFQIGRVDGNRALTNFIGHDVAQDYLRSQVRRRATKVEGIFDVTTSDGHKLRLTTMVTTLRRIQSTGIKAIRATIGEVISQRGAKLTFDQFVQETVLGKLAADIYKAVKKICPVRLVEVRKTKVLGPPPASSRKSGTRES